MKSIRSIGVVGAGQMGRGIAQLAAAHGHDVRMVDTSLERATAGRDRVREDLGRLAQARKLTGTAVDEIVRRIHPESSIGSLAECDLVVEAVSEHLGLKQDVFRELDLAASPAAILASSTSSISLTKLAASTRAPERVIGLHFMIPVPVMKLVEIVRALQTDDETYAVTCDLAQRLGKTVVTTKDMPAFIVNRLLIPQLNEACFALTEGLGTVADIDLAARLGLNHPMGPFELADLIGLDTVLTIAEVLQREFGDDKYRPPAILRNYVAAGWLGRKTGRGFYRYDEAGVESRTARAD
ncbi:MAG: 3-hydroxybutyryl-CoA dehydrogenase [Candidatus Binatota bacterium]|nr:3-hydroxybutyryl-CoA dehydrogenase [Candidatus Binatota bacterium]